MRVLLDCHLPFLLAHGGMQVQIQQTKQALEELGVPVEYLRWWDETQSGDLLHFFGRIPPYLIRFAHGRGMKVVQADLLTGQGSRPLWKHHVHRLGRAVIESVAPSAVTEHFGWASYRLADANIALTTWEAFIMRHVFGAPADRLHVVPNGVETVFLQPRPSPRGHWLVCTATITPRKRVLELAEAAVRAATPVWIIGRAYAESDPYAKRFTTLCQRHPDIIHHEGAINDRTRLAEIYAEARGFVLLSKMESLSLSALEAAACRCPLLLSDLPWARCVFGDQARYCPVTSRTTVTAGCLRKFYDESPSLPTPAAPLSWREVARHLKEIYEQLPAA